MVSDFVDEFNSYLRLSSEEYDNLDGDEKPFKTDAREILQYGAEREGYWDNTKFMVQVGLAEQIARVKYPSEKYDILWLFESLQWP